MSLLTGAVNDGVYTKNKASTEAASAAETATTSKTKAGKTTEYDQEMFLQLLVAEMQYQDPLEPTSNTEYVSELASFSQIEAIQAVQDQMTTIQANSLVGQYVIIKPENGDYVSGKVDYVYNDGGDLQLAIGDKLYDIEDLDSVVDEKYYNAILTVESFTDKVNLLPDVYGIGLSDEEAIQEVRTIYNSMDDYTRGFVSSDIVDKITNLEARIKALKGDGSEGGEA